MNVGELGTEVGELLFGLLFFRVEIGDFAIEGGEGQR